MSALSRELASAIIEVLEEGRKRGVKRVDVVGCELVNDVDMAYEAFKPIVRHEGERLKVTAKSIELKLKDYPELIIHLTPSAVEKSPSGGHDQD